MPIYWSEWKNVSVNDFCVFNSVLKTAILKPLRSKSYFWFPNIRTDNESRSSTDGICVFSAPIWGSNPEDFYLFQNLYTGSAAHLASYSMGTWVLSPTVNGPGPEFYRLLPFRSEAKLYFFPPYTFMAWTQTTLSLPLPVLVVSDYHRSRCHFPVVCHSL